MIFKGDYLSNNFNSTNFLIHDIFAVLVNKKIPFTKYKFKKSQKNNSKNSIWKQDIVSFFLIFKKLENK